MINSDFRFLIGPNIKDVYQKKLTAIKTYNSTGIDRCIIRYFIYSIDDLKRAEEDCGFDLSHAKDRLIHDVRLRYDKMSLILMDFDKGKVKANLSSRFDGTRFERILHEEALNENAYPLVMMKHQEYFKIALQSRRFIDYIPQTIGDFNIFSYNHKQLTKKDQTYRLYLNDRLFIERVWDFNVDSERFCYEEIVSLNKLPRDGLNFKLVTNLNLDFLKVNVNGEDHPATGKSFSLES